MACLWGQGLESVYKIWCECSGIMLAVLTHVKKQLLCLPEHEWLQLSIEVQIYHLLGPQRW